MTAITFRALSRRFLRAYDGVEELLEELRRRDRKLYLLSNAQTDFTRPEIEMLGLTRFFDGIVLSSEQGCKKPSPAFFRKLLEQYGLEPSESIMIGNDGTADISAERGNGYFISPYRHLSRRAGRDQCDILRYGWRFSESRRNFAGNRFPVSFSLLYSGRQKTGAAEP